MLRKMWRYSGSWVSVRASLVSSCVQPLLGGVLVTVLLR